MSTGEIAYLAMAIAAFVFYAGLLGYGVAVASERPEVPAAKKTMSQDVGPSAAKKAA